MLAIAVEPGCPAAGAKGPASAGDAVQVMTTSSMIRFMSGFLLLKGQ